MYQYLQFDLEMHPEICVVLTFEQAPESLRVSDSLGLWSGVVW